MDRPALQEPQQDARGVFDVVHAEILRFFPELVQQLGGNPSELLAAAGLDPASFIAGEISTSARPTYRQVVELLEAAAVSLHAPDFGMRLATLQGGARVFGPLGDVMRNSRTFREALEYVSRHAYAHSLAAGLSMRPLPGQQGAFSGHDILLDRLGNKAQTVEYILLIGNLGAIDLTGGHARARQIHFRHQPVSPAKTYRRYFNCEILFGQNEDGVIYSAQSLACPIVNADAQAYEAAAAYVKAEFTRYRPPLHAEVRGVIHHLLGTQKCTNHEVAAQLKLHPRTLHRYLSAEGTSFHQIKDEVRRDLALYYLQQTGFEITTISEKLGFAEQAVLSRRCKRWFAATPTAVRQKERKQELLFVNKK